MPEPVAAATHYAQGFDQPTARITTTTSTVSATAPSGDVVGDEYFAVYDLGGGTFDATVLCRSSGGFEVLATGGIDPLGGFEFDNRLFNYLGQTHYRRPTRSCGRRLPTPIPKTPTAGCGGVFLTRQSVRSRKSCPSTRSARCVCPGCPNRCW